MRKLVALVVVLLTALTAVASATYIKDDTGITVTVDGRDGAQALRLSVVDDKIVRVTVSATPRIPVTESLVTVARQPGVTPFVVADEDSVVSLTTSALRVTIDLKTAAVTFNDKAGRQILKEMAGGRSFTPIEVEGTRGYTVSQTFESPDDTEGLYGLGQHQSNEFNYKGLSEELFQYNTKVSVPFVVSTGGYGILWDSYSYCRFGNTNDYQQLGDVFDIYDKHGQKGSLTGTYISKKSGTLERREPLIFFETLCTDNLSKVTGLPEGVNFADAEVTYEGFLEPRQSGDYEFKMYYSGYQSIEIDGREVVPERWRTAWNPNSYKFTVALDKGRRVPVKIKWRPNGGVAYCGLRVFQPRPEAERNRMTWWGEMQDMIDYYFIAGDNMDEIIHGYRSLTGRAPVMPRWALGYWQSREKYNTQRQVIETLSEYRRRRLPIDNIVIDWLHWEQDSWGSHEFDRKRFPDPRGMVDTIHSLNGRVMISVWPKFYATTDHFKEFDSRGWMYRRAITDSISDWVGPGYLGSFYDAYNPEARRLFWSQISDHYLPLGIDAWWMDASEPNVRDCVDMDYRKALCGPTYLGPSTKYFNAYALMNAEAIYDGQRRDAPGQRVFLLTRSGFAGQQRYSTATWSGDIATRWEDMEAQIAAGLNFSMSGIPWWTMDIGGFCVEDRFVKAQKLYDKTGQENDDLKEWRELNTRWFQFGAFAPLFRSHGQWPPREVYNIAPEGHPAYSSMAHYLNLRYRLMPYIYSMAAMVHFDDFTIMRPLVMDFPDDGRVRSIKDQYMFGRALMVCPVVRAGVDTRRVYLPEGEVWYDFETGQAVPGGERQVAAPYGRIPLFVPGGSVLPLGPEMQWSGELPDAPVELRVYPGRDGRFTLYDDDGLTYAYERGECAVIPIEWDDRNRCLTIGARRGSYTGMAPSRRFIVTVVGSDDAGSEVIYNGLEQKITL